MAKTLRLMPLLALGSSVSACGVVTESADATERRSFSEWPRQASC